MGTRPAQANEEDGTRQLATDQRRCSGRRVVRTGDKDAWGLGVVAAGHATHTQLSVRACLTTKAACAKRFCAAACRLPPGRASWPSCSARSMVPPVSLTPPTHLQGSKRPALAPLNRTWQSELAVVVEAESKLVPVGSGGKGGVGAAVDVHNLGADATAVGNQARACCLWAQGLLARRCLRRATCDCEHARSQLPSCPGALARTGCA